MSQKNLHNSLRVSHDVKNASFEQDKKIGYKSVSMNILPFSQKDTTFGVKEFFNHHLATKKKRSLT